MVPSMLSVQNVRGRIPDDPREEADRVVGHDRDERVAELAELPLEPAELPRRALPCLGLEPLHRGLAVPAPEEEEQRIGHEQPEESDEEERRRIDAGRDNQQEVAVAGVEGDEQDRVVVDERRRERGADVRHDDEDADRDQQQREAATVELEGLGGLIGRRHGGRSVPACGRGTPSPVLGLRHCTHRRSGDAHAGPDAGLSAHHPAPVPPGGAALRRQAGRHRDRDRHRPHHVRRLGRAHPSAGRRARRSRRSRPTVGSRRSPGTPLATSSCTSPRHAPVACCTR